MKFVINKDFCKSILLCLIVFSAITLHAQQSVVEGYVLNQKDMSPIDNCNVAIEGATSGAVTDQNGFFSLSVKSSDKGKNLAVSFVGYNKVVMDLNSLLNGQVHTILMEESKTVLADVEVSADALVERMYLRKAIEHIGENYVQRGVSFRATYKSQVKDAQGARGALSGTVRIDYNLGYREATPESSFENIFYSFLDIKTDNHSDRLSLETSESYMDALLSCDIVRNGTMILDLANMKRFTLRTEEETDESYTIVYQAENPNFIMSYDSGAEKITGRIVINKINYAVVKNEYWIISRTPDLKRRTLYASDAVVAREYYGLVEYRKGSLGYAPSKYIFKTNEEYAELGIHDISLEMTKPIKSRQYYLGKTNF
ncbi:MAG: carboxypeptidase-like regulatory domain-containing protein [Bacteroidales bacterium]